MRIFNRIVMVIIFLALLALGVFMVLYSFNLFGFKLSNLLNNNVLGLQTAQSGLQNFVNNVQNANLTPLAIAIMVVVAVVGLILLILEFKPPRPKKVRMQQGTYITRDAVEDEVLSATNETPHILDSRANVKARRSPGASVKLQANVRRGEDVGAVRSDLRERIQQRLSQRGVPVSKLKVKLHETDPRQTQSRVR